MGWLCPNCGAMLSDSEVNCCVCQNDITEDGFNE